MGVEYFQITFYVIDFIFGSDCLIDLLELNQSAGFVFHENHPTYVAEIDKNIVKTLMAIAVRNWANKNNFWRTIFDQELFRVRIHESFGFFTIFGILPFSKFVALKCNFPEKIINITQIVERATEWLFAVDSLRTMECRVRILHAINRFDWLRLLEVGFAGFERIIAVFFWSKLRHFGIDFAFIEVMIIGKLTTLWWGYLTVVVLECAGPSTISDFLLHWVISQLLNWLQVLVVYSTQIIVLKLNMLKIRMKNVHFTSILEDNLVV